jgi:uncharacterized protein (TIGR04222 family)
MNREQAELYRRIQEFEIDEGPVAQPFTARLARENGWTKEYAERVVREYKKFAFLALAAGHPVTPSEQVDQAWHLHLTYTRSYWERFCQLLGRPLHHHPTQGGADENRKHVEQYRQTLASYRTVFGEEPPADVWPPASVRFGADLHGVRVNTAQNWVVSKDWPVKLGIVAAVAAVAGTWAGVAFNPFDLTGKAFLGLFLISLVGMTLVAWGVRWLCRQPADDPTESALDLDPYQAAYLAGKDKAVAHAALAALAARGAVEVAADGKKLKFAGSLDRDAHPVEQAVYDTVLREEPVSVYQARKAVKGPARAIKEELLGRGLLVGEPHNAWGRLVPLLLVLGLIATAAFKITIGQERGKPVGILTALCVIGTVVTLVSFVRPLFRSRRGDRALGELRLRHAPLRVAGRTEGAAAPDLALGVGLFGTAILADGPHADLHQAALPPSGGGSGCGTGGGSGGGDGGGGGCGGGGCGGCGGGG